jgi:hypothetical protein
MPGRDRDKNRPHPILDFPGVPNFDLDRSHFCHPGGRRLPRWYLHGTARAAVGVPWAVLVDLPVASMCGLPALRRVMDARKEAEKMKDFRRKLRLDRSSDSPEKEVEGNEQHF